MVKFFLVVQISVYWITTASMETANCFLEKQMNLLTNKTTKIEEKKKEMEKIATLAPLKDPCL